MKGTTDICLKCGSSIYSNPDFLKQILIDEHPDNNALLSLTLITDCDDMIDISLDAYALGFLASVFKESIAYYFDQDEGAPIQELDFNEGELSNCYDNYRRFIESKQKI